MGLKFSTVDSSSPEQIAKAILKVNSTPGLRIQPGIEALWTLFNGPNHTMLRSEMNAKYGAFDLHFGWFCRRVAEELGETSPDVLALVNYSVDANGAQLLTLKASVVAALSRNPKA